MTVRNLLMAGGVLLASAGLAACGDEDRVTRVIDGDTVEMERLGEVRLIGVNAPEKKRCYEDAATRFTREQLEDQVVQYEIGEEPKDRYDRTLAYLSRYDEMHNRALLRGGYAKVLTIPPNDKYEALFERAEREAKNADYGLWDHCDRESIQARRAAAQRRRERAEERRLAAAARREARQARRAAAAEARRAAAAARRAQREAEEQAYAPEAGSGGGSSGGGSSGGGSSGFNCGPGDIDGDGDGRCNE
jgi:endonuclease YncB( thermonuclease family)